MLALDGKLSVIFITMRCLLEQLSRCIPVDALVAGSLPNDECGLTDSLPCVKLLNFLLYGWFAIPGTWLLGLWWCLHRWRCGGVVAHSRHQIAL